MIQITMTKTLSLNNHLVLNIVGGVLKRSSQDRGGYSQYQSPLQPVI